MKPTFIVLTDLSDAANVALRYTTRLATCVHGRLVLLHVHLNIDPLREPEAVMETSPTELANRKQTRADLVLQAKQLGLPADAEVSIETVAAAVSGAVQRHRPVLLALGREQHHSLLSRLIPHRTVSILQAARYPLLLVPEGWYDTGLPHRVMVAADGHSFWLTPPALAIAGLLHQLQPSTSVVHVAPAAHGSSHADMALESVRRTELFGEINGNSLYEVREETPADGILQAAAELNVQLIVLLARPHTFLGGLFHRSVTAQVLRHSPVPVLVLPTTD